MFNILVISCVVISLKGNDLKFYGTIWDHFILDKNEGKALMPIKSIYLSSQVHS